MRIAFDNMSRQIFAYETQSPAMATTLPSTNSDGCGGLQCTEDAPGFFVSPFREEVAAPAGEFDQARRGQAGTRARGGRSQEVGSRFACSKIRAFGSDLSVFKFGGFM